MLMHQRKTKIFSVYRSSNSINHVHNMPPISLGIVSGKKNPVEHSIVSVFLFVNQRAELHMARNMKRFVMLPPVDDDMREWSKRLPQHVPGIDVVIAQTDEEVANLIADADAAYGWVSPEILPSASKLQWLQNPFAGPFEGYYYPALVEHPVTICNPRGIYSDHIAHHILMFVLALSRGLPYWTGAQNQRHWNPEARQRGYIDLNQSTVLILGVGGIGAETARLCSAFGARVIGIEPRPEHETSAEIYPPTALSEHLPTADFVVTTVPHTPETDRLWDARRFTMMKSSAYFINIGRGKTCSLDDLTHALKVGEIAGAGLDVFETEPLPANHPLWTMENVIITPHIAVADAENISERRYTLLRENATRFVQGQSLKNVVDKGRWY